MDPDNINFFALINPEIVAEEEEIDHEEGCLKRTRLPGNHLEETEVAGQRNVTQEIDRVRRKGFWPLPWSMKWIISTGFSSSYRMSGSKRESTGAN